MFWVSPLCPDIARRKKKNLAGTFSYSLTTLTISIYQHNSLSLFPRTLSKINPNHLKWRKCDPLFLFYFSLRHSVEQVVEMSEESAVTVYSNSLIADTIKNHFSLKVGMAQMLRGGAIVEVSSLHQAKVAESAGACSVLVSDPSQADGRGISRMPDLVLVKEIKRAVSIPVIARSRVGHFVESQILEAIGVDYIDESEVIALADEGNFVNKHNFRTPFICGCKSLGQALNRIREGAAMIRTQGEIVGSGNIAETVKNIRSVMGDIRVLNNMDEDEVFAFARKISAPYDLIVQTKQMGRLPVVHFAAGGIVTPADAALMMQLGCDGVFIGLEVFDCLDPYKRIHGIVRGVRHYSDPHVLAESSCERINQERIEQFGSRDV